ncbi:MAG: HAMP domain-containing sensor histidine kinase [Nocardioides sp.]|uniref:sensor histidine kinase n=1 Tax=Nocardioides sp. TaxID=35761 RepID=UPI00238E7DE8|nr:HAMP domain-containing sensor histidine kinase [Nocardioides sp.]MDE0777721.1 HAMP domain-containing sensor histidine kinase [Nocardioides sp.]
MTTPNRRVRPVLLPALVAALLGRAAAIRGNGPSRPRRLSAWRRWAPGRRRLEEVMRAADERDHRMAAATHDFLNALAGLAGYLELLADEPATEQSRELQRKAHNVAERLGYLGEDLLVHATAGSARLSIEPVLVSVLEELRSCALAFPRLEIHLDVDEDLMVVADPLRLHQVLGNLIRNAQRYGRPPVAIGARSTNKGWVEIVVSDAGDGIPPDFVAAMFDRHTRATGTGTIGTGIGLAVARELAERQAGRLDYRADGNRFILTLPAGTVGG